MGQYFEQDIRLTQTGGSNLSPSGAPQGAVTAAVTNDVTIFNWTALDTTMTPTRVDTGTVGTTTGTATFNATDSVAAQNLQTVIRALGGIYADATVTAGVTADNMIITVYGGYDITWTKTGTGTITESGAAGSDTATPGKVTYTGYIPGRGPFAEVKRLKLKGFADNSLDVTITDAKNLGIFTATAIDTYTAGDTPFVKLLTADGVAGEDGAAAANVSGGVFDAPFKCVVATSAPVTVTQGNIGPLGLQTGAIVSLVLNTPYAQGPKQFLKRSTGAIVSADANNFSTTVNLGADYANIKRIRLFSSADATVAPTVKDADLFTAYTKTSTDYTTAVVAQLSHEGVDQANNAVADLLDCVVRSPVTVSGTGLASGSFSVEFIVEV